MIQTRTRTSPTVAPVSGRFSGQILSGILAALLALDAVVKFVKPEPVVEATLKFGLPEASIIPMGLTLLLAVVLYSVRRTAILGAVLLTGYLGGATATHVRAADGAFSLMLPVIIGALCWLALYLRDTRVRELCRAAFEGQ